MARFSRQELVELIESMEAGGQDASRLRAVLATLPQPSQSSRPGSSRFREEEPTTAEYLNIRVGDLFVNGVTDEVLAQLIEMDRRYSLKELQAMCRNADLGASGDKKTLAAKLLASNSVEKPQEEEQMESTIEKGDINLSQQREWSGKPGAVAIPEAYIKDLRYEIVVFTKKERGGSDFAFRCKEYQMVEEGAWRFTGVMIDTSIKDTQGEVEQARLTYHPEVMLVNIGFMVIPATEGAETSSDS